MSRDASPEFSPDYERTRHFMRGRHAARETQLKWIAVPCSVSGCDRSAHIREDDDPNTAVCIRCWSWYDSPEDAAAAYSDGGTP